MEQIKNPILKKIMRKFEHAKFLSPHQEPFQIQLLDVNNESLNVYVNHTQKTIGVEYLREAAFCRINLRTQKYVEIIIDDKKIEDSEIVKIEDNGTMTVININTNQIYTFLNL